jgi:hypothetical protein
MLMVSALTAPPLVVRTMAVHSAKGVAGPLAITAAK